MGMLPVEIADAVARGAGVVTANQRAARVLRRGMEVVGGGGQILAVDAWGAALWRRMTVDGLVDRMLMNRSQEHTVWRAVVALDRESAGLRSADAMAVMAADAWSLLCRYNGQGRLRELGVSTDTRAFQRWAMAFERRCRRDGLLSQAELWLELEAAADRAELPVTDAGVMLVGFDQILPAQERLFETLRRAGYSVERYEDLPRETPAYLIEAEGEREEVRAAALWARHFLEARPEARLAVIVPAMEGRRAVIDRIFGEVLAPELGAIEAVENAGPYEFSLGRPLADTAMGVAALRLLRWTVEPLELEEVSELLLSPCFGGGGQSAEFDAFKLRPMRSLRPEMTLERMSRAVEKIPGLGELGARLRGMLRVAAREQFADGGARPYGEWAEGFHRLLEAAGWPGRTALDSVQFQTLRRWESALDELATLDFDGSRATFAEALAALERIARQTIFAPESREAPVQMMGPLEAAGQNFDGIWFLGAGDLGWPAAASSSPLLPWEMQRELGMPGADAVRDRALSEAVTRRIRASAGEVIFSYAVETSGGRQKASPLLADLVPEGLEFGEEIRSVAAYEVVADDVRLPGLPDRVFSGGATVLAAQAACGFKAFAEHRLWATRPEGREPGMDALERGSLVHDVMEKFWHQVQDQATLLRMSAGERAGLLEECIEAAMFQIASKTGTDSAWEMAYLETQRQRLEALLLPWLELEMSRPEFAVMDRELQMEDVAVGPLRLRVRVDRVDETAGGALIVDYKTGPASPAQWLGDRPDAPQLPLYAILADPDQLGGVAFALLRAGDDLEMKGYATEDTVLARPAKMKVAGLREQLDEWRLVLTRLAEEFSAGMATVAPKRYPLTCAYCAQRVLCRLDVSRRNDDEDDAEVPLG